ncbi:MAG: stage II sporulation protein D [Oscillospiraceae bacterium]|nr:stage II sporulation protein D [Oscillospiraceae bacterium]
MKHKAAPLAVFALLVALTPALALLPLSAEKSADSAQQAETAEGTAGAPDAQETVLAYDEASKQVLELTMDDYVLGAVLCEMPASYEAEALKAQAVACRSYALYVKDLRAREPLPELNGAYFSVNTAAMIGYMNEEKARSYFGSDFSKYYNKVKDAVEAVRGCVLTSDGAPICACYHAISPGRTEDSGNIFAASLPYLASVDSAADKTAQGYASTATFSPSELAGILAANDSGFSASGDPSGWLGTTSVSEAGTVLALSVCGRTFSGTRLRTLLGLRSAAFDVVYDASSSVFVFAVRGYGHGVGMSQYGANALAQQGYTFGQILAHYYTGAQLTSSAE